MRFCMMFSVLGMMSGLMVGHALDVDTVNSGMGEENLAPLSHVSAGVPMASPTVPPSPSVPGGADVEEEAAADPYTVKGVVVSLSGTTGFDRDAALEQGARQSLPGVLAKMGMEPAKAESAVKSLGSTMRFVKGYKVVRESLIPTYTLTADISFNPTLLTKNFGKALPAKGADVTAQLAVEDTASAAPVTLQTWVVKLADGNPASVDRVRMKLNGQASTKATYRLLTSESAEFLVETPLDAEQVKTVAGADVDVVAPGATSEPVAAPAVLHPAQAEVPAEATKSDMQPWQGRDDKGADVVPQVRPWFPWGRN